MKGGWSITSTKEDENTIDIYIQLKVAVLNSSTDKTINLNSFAAEMAKSLKLCYEISFFEKLYIAPKNSISSTYNYLHLNWQPIFIYKLVHTHLNVIWRIISTRLPLQNEHLVEIKNAVEMTKIYAKVNEFSGSEIYVNASKVLNMISGYDLNTLAHEFGHSLGLRRPDINESWFSWFGRESEQYLDSGKQALDPHNVMYSGTNKFMNDNLSTHFSHSQMERIISNIRNKAVNQ